jgi:hypothetical protein
VRVPSVPEAQTHDPRWIRRLRSASGQMFG